MTTLSQLRQARFDRDAAKADFDAVRGHVSADLDARGLGSRAADRATNAATDVFVEAIELADQHRGVVAGTIVALMLWVFRSPIFSAIEHLLDREHDDREDTPDD